MEHSENILNIMQERSITAYSLAKSTGIDQSLFSKWKSHPTSEISSIKLEKIANALECSVDYLLGRTENPSCNSSETGYNRNKENTPAPAEPETGDIDDYEDDLFYQALIADGRVREGEDITSAQLRIFASVLEIIDAAFPKLSDVQRGKTSKTG